MSNFSVPEHLPDWIKNHVREYLDSGGKEGHMWDSSIVGGPGPLPCLLICTKGRKSGNYTTLPLLYGETKGGYVIVASRGGSAHHPGWYLNLKANPEIDIQVGTERMRIRARETSGQERDALWNQMAELYPPYIDYQEMTDRKIPVLVLEKIGG